MSIDINKINGVIPLLVVWFIIAIASGHTKDIFSINICEWLMIFGSLNIISSILIILFNSDVKKFFIKLIIGISLLILGGIGMVEFYPSPESYSTYEVTQQLKHRTDFSKSMSIRLEQYKEWEKREY